MDEKETIEFQQRCLAYVLSLKNKSVDTLLSDEICRTAFDLGCITAYRIAYEELFGKLPKLDLSGVP